MKRNQKVLTSMHRNLQVNLSQQVESVVHYKILGGNRVTFYLKSSRGNKFAVPSVTHEDFYKLQSAYNTPHYLEPTITFPPPRFQKCLKIDAKGCNISLQVRCWVSPTSIYEPHERTSFPTRRFCSLG